MSIVRAPLLVVGIMLGCCWQFFPATTQAAEPDRRGIDSAIEDAARDLEIAQLRLRRYDRVEYPSSLRHLESQIKLAQAELEIWRHRMTEYASFDRWVGSSPMLITLDDAKLNVLRFERLVADLRADKESLEHSRRDQLRLHELEAQSAASRLLKLRQARARGAL